jgi:flagellar hook-associated protein 1 FlgK
VNVNSGIIKAQLENLTTTSPNNKIIDYKDKLDSLASALSDIYSKYVVEDNGSYTYGNISTDSYNGTKTVENLGLFSGSTVKTLVFNEEMVNDLDQEDLDYISSMQWKDDIDFDGFAQDGSTQEKSSFSEFFQEVRVNISSDKENNDFLKETQTAVVQSLEASYEQLTKVDSDEEMINLIQFQAAYTANAKIITVVDEMLQTLLGIRR